MATLPVGRRAFDLNQKIGRHVAVKLTGSPIKNEGFGDWDSDGSGIPRDSHLATNHQGSEAQLPDSDGREAPGPIDELI